MIVFFLVGHLYGVNFAYVIMSFALANIVLAFYPIDRKRFPHP